MGVTRRDVLASTAAASLASPAMSKSAGGKGPRVAVIGAGVFGAWSALQLVRGGAQVMLVDMHRVGHARASSGGESRVIRRSYGGDPLYSAMAGESLGEWDVLSRRQSQPILHRTGVLWFSPQGDAYMAKSLDWLRVNDIAHGWGNRGWLAARWPQIAFREGESGFLETDSGALIAGRGVQAVVAEAGVEPLRSRAAQPERLANGRYRIAGGEVDALVYACGPWLPALFPEVLSGRIVPTRQEVLHFGAPPRDTRFAAPAMPVWADFNGGDMAYGLPDREGQGFALAFDRHGPHADPDSSTAAPRPKGWPRRGPICQRGFPRWQGPR